MGKCICLNGCPFFNDNMAGMPSMSESLKEKYCLGDNSKCARFMVFSAKGKGAVPADLFPHQKERAVKIIEG